MYGTLKKIFAFAGSKKELLKKSLLFSFLSGLFSAMQFAALFVVIGALVSDNRDGKFIWLSLGIMAVSLIGRIITTYFSTMEQTETGYCMVAEKRIHIGDRLRYIPMGYFNKNSIGNITAIVTTTLGDVENSAARVLVSVLGGFFNSVALVIVLLVFDWRIGLVAAAGVLIYLAAAELALRKSAALSGVRQHTQESLVESVLEYIQGMGIVKAFGLERDSTQSIGSAIKASCRDNLKLTKASVPYDAIKQAVVRVFSVLLLLASVWFWLDGSLPLAYGLILVIASFMVFNDLENAGNMASLLQMLAASMDTANSIDDTPVMDEKGADITPKSSEIVFNKVDFSYADRKILDQVSFTIAEKTTTAIVGPSGAGKTTMCNLIARFWDVNAGKITIGGTDVRDFKLDSLMKNISMVFQSVYLFADTIENNIKFGCPDATHEQVVEAAKKACCHDFISALPDGYDTVIGEGGGTLSGGEKQRISIARAMLKDAPIIILDEATSSVDPENEDELQRAKAMWQRNNGRAEEELQIKFTGYLIQAVRRTQRDYLKALYAYSNQETLTDTIFVVSQTLEQEVMERLPLWENIESGALLYALKQLDERERYVFLARVLDKRPFDVIGVQLGLSYKGAAAVYYRVIRKLKKSIEGVNGYDI